MLSSIFSSATEEKQFPEDSAPGSPNSPAAMARARLRQRAEALAAGRYNEGVQPAADAPSKASFAEESATHIAEDWGGFRSTSAGRKRSPKRSSARSARSASPGRSGGSARHSLDERTGKMSSRYKAMTAREAEDEKRVRDAFMSARRSARNHSLRAAAERTPLASSTPPQQEWRQWPSGISPETRETNKLWDEQDERIRTLAAGGSSPEQQDEGPLYGSQRPLLTGKEREYALQSALQRRARRLKWEAKAKEAEKDAVVELESKRRRHDLLLQKQRSARGNGLTRKERKVIQQRLYASPRREARGAVYA